MNKFNLALMVGCSLAALATAPRAHAQQAVSAAKNSDDIVVTATRREEQIQKVGVSVQAFTGEKLAEQNITQSTDLTRLVPGAKFTQAGGAGNSTFYLRGQGRDTIGPISPSVITYINEVPLASWGNIVPTFDMANVQILKGPQGTLFGRNTTGGAVLLYTQQPKYEFGGYLQGLIGSYNWKEVEGAINIPLIADKLAIRVAAQSRSRDGYTKSLNGGFSGDNFQQESYRASILFEPTSWIKNVTVGDYFYEKNNPAFLPDGTYFRPGGAGATFRAFPASFDCGTSPSCDVDLFIQRQLQEGFRTYRNNPGFPKARPKIYGVSNTTTVELGPVTVKNIFGYRGMRITSFSDTDGTDMTMINVNSFHSDDQLSDELQFSGDLFNGNTKWLAGAFILDNTPGGPNALKFDLFRSPTVAQNANPLSSVQNQSWVDNSHAVFGSIQQQVPFIPGLKLNASLRQTWDYQKICGSTERPYSSLLPPDFEACTNPAFYTGAAGLAAVPADFFVHTTRSNKLTWQFGADYQFTDKILGYVVARRGYRAGGNNSPGLTGGPLASLQTFAPQTLDDVEVGLKADWELNDWRGRVNIAAYRGTYDSYQVALSGLPPTINAPGSTPSNTSMDVNGGDAIAQGVDLDGFIEPMRDLRFTFAAAWIDGRIDSFTTIPTLQPFVPTAKTFPNTPKWSYTLAADYTFPFKLVGGDLKAHADYYWVDKYRSGYAPFPSYGLTNASLSLDNIGGRPVDATFFIQNVTDEVYRLAGQSTGASPGFFTYEFAPPRMYGLRVRYTFSGI
jgi:iron complex outermembrane recepter protein